MRHHIKTIALAALLACGLPAVAATPIQLKFEGVATTTVTGGVASTPDVPLGNFYESTGTVVSGPAIVTSATDPDVGGDGNFKRQRTLITSTGTFLSDALGDGAMYAGGTGSGNITIDPSLEFDTGLSFFYVGEGQISVDTDLGTFGFTFPFVTPTDPKCSILGNTNCEWQEARFSFIGNATSVTFIGPAGSFLLDNVTLGGLDPLNPVDPSPPPIPEPSTYALMALGLAAVGFAARRRQRRG